MNAPADPWPAFWRGVVRLSRFDLQRFRVLAAAMVGLELLRAAYVEWSLHLAPTALGERFAGASGEMETALVDLAIRAMTWIVTAVVVQADHPSDGRAFWRTRPIAPHAVALAKLTVLGLVFVDVPVLLNAVRLAAYGAPFPAHVAAAVQIAVDAGSTIVPAWALAILTRTLPRFLAGTAGVVVGGYLIFMAVLFYLGLAGMSGVGSMSVGVGFDAFDWTQSSSLGWLAALALVAIGFAILLAHYRLRRTWATLAAGAALMILPGMLGPWGRPPAPPPDLAALVAVPLRPAEGLWLDSTVGGGGAAAMAFMGGRLALPGLPRDVSAGVFVDRVRVLVDGRDVAVSGFRQCCLGFGSIAAASAQPAPSLDGEGWSEELAVVRGSAVSELLAKPVTLDAEATVVFVRHGLAASIPLAPGAAFRGDGYVVEVLAVSDALRVETVLLRLTRFPHLSRDAAPLLSFFEADPSRTIVNKGTSPDGNMKQPWGNPGSEWAQGRRWAARHHVPLLRARPVGPDPRLLVVESRRAGEARARIAEAGAPAAPQRPRRLD